MVSYGFLWFSMFFSRIFLMFSYGFLCFFFPGVSGGLYLSFVLRMSIWILFHHGFV